MTYTITVHNAEGDKITTLPAAFTMAAARQAMLDHSNTVDLPAELPWHGPAVGVLEGWFIGRTEYLIGMEG